MLLHKESLSLKIGGVNSSLCPPTLRLTEQESSLEEVRVLSCFSHPILSLVALPIWGGGG